MIRTKDLLLFVVVLIMLFMAIFATLASRMMAKNQLENSFHQFESVEHDYAASTKTNSDIDRSATIERLRKLLSAGDVIEASPSVERSPTPEKPQTSPTEQACAEPGAGIAIARQWPLNQVSVRSGAVVRSVVAVAPSSLAPAPATASGTLGLPVPVNETSLLELPMYPIKADQPQCLATEIVGVTSNGSLLFNNDAVLHKQTGPDTLIGYALDGFPIYGAYYGAVDECGGFDAPTGYRYVVSPEESTFVNCFVGTPRAFSL